MADIKKDPAQDWDLSDEYYQENPQSDELRLEDFMDSSSKESAETTGTFLSDRHTANTEELSQDNCRHRRGAGHNGTIYTGYSGMRTGLP